MDRPIRKKVVSVRCIVITIIAAALLVVSLKIVVFQEFNPAYKIKRSEILTSVVTEQIISKTVQTIGLIEPVNRISIEADENGQIETFFITSGSFVQKSDPILKLVNEDLVNQCNVLEESLIKQNQYLTLCREESENMEIENRDAALELNYKVETMAELVARNRMLYESESIARNTLEDSQKEYDFWQQKRALFLEKWESDRKVQKSRTAVIELDIESINNRLSYLRRRLARLSIKAPASGIINLADFSIGQTIGKQEIVGVIDRQDRFKMTAEIDEFYLSNISIGDIAQFTLKGTEDRPIEAELVFISPEVQGSQVKLEFSFLAPLPKGIISGQSFNIKIIQGEAKVTRVIENGGFYNDSGGNWVYRIEGNGAEKVAIKAGIKNNDFIEILSGLKLGDEVIISNYRKYRDFNRLEIKEN